VSKTESAHLDRDDLWPGSVAALILFIWYLATMPTGLMFFDSGELALVGYQLGLGHPPGQPLYTVILKLSTLLWPGDPLTAMNGISACAAAACALPVDRLMVRAGQHDGRVRIVVLVLCGLAYPVWDQAARIELYSLSTLLVLIGLNYGAQVIDVAAHRWRDWFTLGVLTGLTACVNPVHAVALAAAVGLGSLRSLYSLGISHLLGRVGMAALGSLVGCLPYLHLVWVHAKIDRFIWGQLADAQAVLNYLLGADYAHTDHSSWTHIGTNLADWLVWGTFHGFTPVLVVGYAGLLMTQWTRRHCLLWLTPMVTGMLFSFSYGTFYSEVPDFSAYLLPSIWWAGIGLAVVLSRTEGRLKHSLVGAIAILSLVGTTVFGTHLDRSKNDLAREISRTWLESIPPKGILLLESDHLVFPAMYLQHVEGLRPDVVVLNIGFAASRWYWDALYRQHPDLNRIELKPGDRGHRIRQFLLLNPERAHRAENIKIAGLVGIRPCLSTWGLGLGLTCPQITDQPERFSSRMRDFWNDQVHSDPVSGRVLANLAYNRAETALALGQYTTALHALREGVPLDARPESIPVVPNSAPLKFPEISVPLLIGHPARNLRVGQQILRSIDSTGSTSALGDWKNAETHPSVRWH
jgi:hypothetical protein